jgi:hypothetical protein
MAQQYYNSEQAAKAAGITVAELIQMRERGEIRGFRDSGDWKFKREEIEQLVSRLQSRPAAEPAEGGEDSEDVLLTELELGESEGGSSGTVIGSSEPASEESDVKLAGSDVAIGSGEKVDATADTGEEVEGPADDLELDLTIDEDVPLEDSQISLADTGGAVKEGSGGSGLELGEELDDDDLVLGGSGSGSDITIGQDSGISLVDPHDSGLSLDEPMELASDDESLALGEDEMLTLSEEADAESPTELKTDDDFLLTPLEEATDEDSESGSQVIALDSEEGGEEAATMVSGGVGAPGAPMLDEDFVAVPTGLEPEAAPVFPTAPLGAPTQVPQPAAPQTVPLAGGAPAALPEAPYGTLPMVGLGVCLFFLLLSGIMAFDLMRNMWSWGGEYSLNSSLMDWIIGLLP